MRVEGSASDCSGSHSARFSSSAVGRLTATVSLLVTVAVAVLVVVDLWALTAGAQGAQDSEAATDVSAGGAHTCAVLADGSVWCWGSDDAGRLGDGIVEEPLLDPVPSRVVGIDDAVAISAGSAHSCAVLVDGSVWCWGFGMGGQLGNGRAVFDAPAPVRVVGIDDAVAVSAGHAHSCAVLGDGSVSCWGWDGLWEMIDGLLAVPWPPPSSTTVRIDDAVAVSAGGHHSCAVLADGSVWCWSGLLGGNAMPPYDSVPSQVVGVGDAVAVSAGWQHSCAVLADGSVSCWGWDNVGELGRGAVGDLGLLELPGSVARIDDAVGISAGFEHTCAVLVEGSVSCWGSDRGGALGDGFVGDPLEDPLPDAVAGVDDVVAVSAGGRHSCAVLVDGSVSCWGSDRAGALGDGAADDADGDPVPGAVVGLGVSDEPSPSAVGYWMVDAGGEIYGFGDAVDPGGVSGRAVAVSSTPYGEGVWVLTDDGVVHALGGGPHHGDVDAGVLSVGEVPATISVLPDGSGYWVFTDLGRAISFGGAGELEDLVDLGISGVLNGPVVASVATTTGEGAYMIGSDGGVFALGDAVFHGSTGDVVLNEPVVGVAADPDGVGYWLVAADGGVFAFEAEFRGSVPGVLEPGTVLNAPVTGVVPFGDGYLMVATDGGVFNFSDQEFLGSLADDSPAFPVTAITGYPR